MFRQYDVCFVCKLSVNYSIICKALKLHNKGNLKSNCHSLFMNCKNTMHDKYKLKRQRSFRKLTEEIVSLELGQADQHNPNV